MNLENTSSSIPILSQPVFHVFVPASISTKKQLLDLLGTGLKFPECWGRNWDALDDLLDDLSWIDEKTVWIEHEIFPNIGKSDLETYLEILNYAVTTLREDGAKRLIVSFG